MTAKFASCFLSVMASQYGDGGVKSLCVEDFFVSKRAGIAE
jgi:hypothetical protein